MFGRDCTTLSRCFRFPDLFAIEGPIQEQHGGDREDTANSDGDEWETALCVTKPIHACENERDRRQEAEENGEVEGYVDGKRCDDRFGEEHVDGSEKHNCHDVFEECQAGRSWWQRGATRFRSFGEDYLLVCFLRKDRKYEPEESEEY